MTLEDYFHDYYYLSQDNYMLVLKEAQVSRLDFRFMTPAKNTMFLFSQP